MATPVTVTRGTGRCRCIILIFAMCSRAGLALSFTLVPAMCGAGKHQSKNCKSTLEHEGSEHRTQHEAQHGAQHGAAVALNAQKVTRAR